MINNQTKCKHTLVWFVASDILTTICHLAIVNVCVIIILSIGNIQISIPLLCFLYLFVELMMTMNECILFKPNANKWEIVTTALFLSVFRQAAAGMLKPNATKTYCVLF